MTTTEVEGMQPGRRGQLLARAREEWEASRDIAGCIERDQLARDREDLVASRDVKGRRRSGRREQLLVRAREEWKASRDVTGCIERDQLAQEREELVASRDVADCSEARALSMLDKLIQLGWLEDKLPLTTCAIQAKSQR